MKLKQAGFTLIELLVVMVMVGILAAISVPDFQQYQIREQMRASVTDSKSLLSEAFAQARAQSQSQQVSLILDTGLKFCSIEQGVGVTTDCKELDLPTPVKITLVPSTVTEWKYLAPYGDIADVDSFEIVLTHDSGVIKKIKVHKLSGLIEEL